MMKQTMRRNLWLTCLLAIGAAGAAHAQVGQLSDAEKSLPGARPPKADAGRNIKPNSDPRNFTGSWRVDMGNGGGGGGPPGGGMGAGGPPGGGAGGPPGGGGGGPGAGGPPGGGAGGPPGGGAGGNPDLNPTGNQASAGQLPSRILCLPQEPLYTGVDGPTTLTQTPELINWSSEEMHHHRRIYLTGSLPTNPKPSYGGVSVGHWDGNTLVVETVGLNSQKTGTKMIERWTKTADGKQLNIAVSYVDAAGKTTKGRDVGLNWANGLETLEWFCEDYNDEWLPGGAAYEDTVGK
jgi:hypothetical protein